jgi:hypothetical protein
MPLSEHEKRLLAEMEEALAADDPRLISTFKGKTPSRSRVVIGFLLVVVGVLLLLSAMISQTPILGIAAFAISLVGAVLAISNLGGLMAGVAGRAPRERKNSKWSARFEERWDRRNPGE